VCLFLICFMFFSISCRISGPRLCVSHFS
jgi:hypothetical protein